MCHNINFLLESEITIAQTYIKAFRYICFEYFACPCGTLWISKNNIETQMYD